MAVYRGDDPIEFRAAVNSIVTQKFTAPVDSRIYLAVDGPVPEALSREIDSIEPELYRVVRIKVNGGLANALNTLIGELDDECFVFRMDADDRSEPERYQIQLDYLAKATKVDILGTDIF